MRQIKFPENLLEMLDHWENYPQENVGWCLLCDGPIRSEADMIPGTNTHACSEGVRLNRSLHKTTTS
jgi:hypothetical protein